MLAEYAPDDGRVLAGGQSLVPTMAFRLARPHHLIDINGIAALDRLAVEDGRLVIGAGVRHQTFRRPVVAGPLGELLSTVMHHIAHYPIRTRGTFCGSVAHADPASEWCLVAATLGAEMVARSTRGVRTIAAADYFQGIMTTALEPDELLAEVRLPLLAGGDALGLLRVQPPRRRFRARHGARHLRRRGRRDRILARRRRRGRGACAPDRGGRSAARRPAARCGRLHCGGCSGGRRDRSADRRADRRRSIAASSSPSSPAARWSGRRRGRRESL